MNKKLAALTKEELAQVSGGEAPDFSTKRGIETADRTRRMQNIL